MPVNHPINLESELVVGKGLNCPNATGEVFEEGALVLEDKTINWSSKRLYRLKFTALNIDLDEVRAAELRD